MPKFPRALIEVSGVPVDWRDIISVKVENTLYMAADSFEATFRNDSLLSDWLRKEQEVRIFFGYVKDPLNWSKSELVHFHTGKIDGVRPAFGSTRQVQIIGRDYSAPLVDTEYSVAYQERTSSQIAQMLAKAHNLKPLITSTSEIIPKDIFSDKKEWDILQTLADREGFVCYVTKEKELYFGPRKDSDETYIMEFRPNAGEQTNCTIDFDDSSVGVYNTVTVKHWHKKKLIKATARNEFLIKQMNGQVKELVVYDSKAKSESLAKASAEKRLKERSRAVITGKYRTAGNPYLQAEKKINVKGCGRFDGPYYLENVVLELNKRTGFTAEGDITNLRPETAQQYRADMYENKGAKM